MPSIKRIFAMTSRTLRLTGLLLACAAGLCIPQTLHAQQNYANGVYYPMNQYMPAGEAGAWIGRLGKAVPGYYQPVRVILPSEGEVTFFSGSMTEPVSTESPADLGIAIGFPYRIQIRNLPEFPGVELYPTIELLDRLHPPPGHEHEFPVPVEISVSDLEQVLAGRMVTKVVYLEQPQVALPVESDGASLQFDLAADINLFAEADKLGRPLAIVRIGGRLPHPTQDLASYLWSPAPIAWEPADSATPAGAKEVFRPADEPASRRTSQKSLSAPRISLSYTQPLN